MLNIGKGDWTNKNNCVNHEVNAGHRKGLGLK